MKLENFVEEHLIEIVRLYEEHCGSGRDYYDTMHNDPSYTLKNLRHYGNGEYRIGSRWDCHSKLYIDTVEGNVRISFNSNFHPMNRQGKVFEEAEKSGEAFVNAAMQYLSSQ